MAAIIRQHPRKLIAGGCLVAFYFSPYSPTLFRSYGVQNIENRYSAGGGSHNHSPGQATKLGDSSHVTGNQIAPKGMGTPHYQEKIGGQKPEEMVKLEIAVLWGRDWDEGGVRERRDVVDEDGAGGNFWDEHALMIIEGEPVRQVME
ncbi:MAG: hypothetical protein Q9197_000070 [Variospora fuerteventurae]